MMQINVKVENTEFFINGLNNLSKDIMIPKEAMTDVGQRYLDVALQNWEMDGRVFQTDGWAPLTPYTVAIKKKFGWPEKMLLRTGLLRSSYAFTIEDGGRQVSVFNNAPYAGAHQFGEYPNHPKGWHARILLQVDDARIEMVKSIISSWLDGRIKYYGLE